MLEELGIKGEVIPLTGGSGIMDKVFVMDAFGRVAFEINNSTVDPNAVVNLLYYHYALLPNLLVMPATFAANCGVSSLVLLGLLLTGADLIFSESRGTYRVPQD